MIPEFELVVLTRDVPEHGLVAGDVGAVAHRHEGGEAYEVEFCYADGSTFALLTLSEPDIRPREGREILRVRERPTS